MDSQPNSMSEEELAQRVLELHGKGLGCRRISTALNSEGFRISKDKVWKIIREYKAKKGKEGEVEQARGFKSLKQKEEHLKEQLERERKKEEYRKSVVDLTIKLLMTSYEKRRQYFSYKKKLFQLTESIIQVRNPCLWKRFLGFCEHHSDPAIAVFTAIGGQESFEQQLIGGKSCSESLDSYIERRLNESLEAWTKPLEEEESEDNKESSSEDSQLKILTKWEDDHGDLHILFQRGIDENDEEY